MKIFAAIKAQFVVWVWNHTPNCAEMARLTSRSLEQPATAATWMKMRLHFAICAWCRRYFEQIHFLHHAAPQLDAGPRETFDRGLSSAAKHRITQKLLATSEVKL